MKALRTVVLIVSLASPLAEAEPPKFRVTDIGSLAGLSTFATALNDEGQVVGYSLVGTAGPHSAPPGNAFLYSNGAMTDLFPGDRDAFSAATAINGRGQVVGYRRWDTMSASEPFQYSQATGVIFLDPFETGSTVLFPGAASDINGSGQIVGSATTLSFQSHAFLWSPSSTPALDLTPVLSTPYFGSGASAVNDGGQVVGMLNKPGRGPLFDTRDSFFYDGTNLFDLDAILSATHPGTSFEPQSINSDGIVVGYVYGVDYPVHAFIYANGFFVDLGTLGGDHSLGYGIDTSGRVVGQATRLGETTPRAFLWEDGVMYDLNDRVPAGLGILLSRATAINDQGQITVWGYAATETYPPDAFHSFLLTPGTPSSAIDELIDVVVGMDLHHGIENSLLAKLQNALAAVEAGDTATACNLLGAFMNEVSAQTGKKIPTEDAEVLIDAAASVRAMLGCV